MESCLYNLFLKHPLVCTDTRNIVNNSIFFALKGTRFDGNRFAFQALEKGAAYAVVDDSSLATCPQIIPVDNVLKTLQDLASKHRRKLHIPIIAITGTNGKTTTKELITQVLATKFTTIATQGNLNNHIGVPLTLLRMDNTTQIGVVEMGASHIHEIATLCRIAQPDYGLITNIGKAHLEGFGSPEGVQKAKAELYDYLTETGGTAFYNADDTTLCNLIEKQPSITRIPYGISKNQSTILPNSDTQPFLRLIVKDYPDIHTHLIGSYNASNVLAALIVGATFGVPAQKAATAVSNYIPSNNRSQLLHTAQHTLIMDAYNANPTSMAIAIEHFVNLPAPNKWLILGDMLELGQDSIAEHETVIKLLQAKQCAQTLLVGHYFMQADVQHAFKSFPSVKDLRNYLYLHPITPHATLLIKGSRGIGLEEITTVL